MNPTLNEAIKLRNLGFAIHWLRQNSKIPILSGWSEAPVMTVEELTQTYRQGYNIGFRPGKFTVVNGKEICVLDVDVRGGERYGDEAYAAAKSLMGVFEPNVMSGSGVGRHQLVGFDIGKSPDKAAMTLRESDLWLLDGKPCQPQTKNSRPAWQVELLSTGKNVVLPPSIHPDTNKPYIWLKELNYENM